MEDYLVHELCWFNYIVEVTEPIVHYIVINTKKVILNLVDYP